MTSSEAVRKSLVAKMDVIAGEIEKQEKLTKGAQKQVDSYNADDAWVEETLKQIYGWRQTGIAPDEHDYDQLPLEVKRLAVEASGIHIDVFPTSWEGRQSRMNVYFEHLCEKEWLSPVKKSTLSQTG
jgi:hypothetical protein